MFQNSELSSHSFAKFKFWYTTLRSGAIAQIVKRSQSTKQGHEGPTNHESTHLSVAFKIRESVAKNIITIP